MADKSLTLSCAQSGTSFTTKLNDALEALNTMRSGSSAPTNNLEDGVMWLDTSGADKVIKIRIGGVFHPLLDFDGSNWFAERAEEATKLATARNIALTGKVTGTASFDGTDNATIATTLDTSGTWTGTATSATSAGTASTATKLTIARTITLGTDLSGNVNFDGGSNVTLNATLDADTVGDSELSAGGTLADGKVLTGTGDTTFAWEEAGGGAPGGLALVRTSGSGDLAVPAGIKRAIISGCGGGSGFCQNFPGSSSGSAYRAETTVTAGGTLAWSVGTGGNNTTSTNSGSSADGNDTTVNGSGASVTLQAGQGNNNDLNNSGTGPEGGTASGLTGLTAAGTTVNRAGSVINTRGFATYGSLTDGAIHDRGTGAQTDAQGGAAATGGFLVIEWGT